MFYWGQTAEGAVWEVPQLHATTVQSIHSDAAAASMFNCMQTDYGLTTGVHYRTRTRAEGAEQPAAPAICTTGGRSTLTLLLQHAGPFRLCAAWISSAPLARCSAAGGLKESPKKNTVREVWEEKTVGEFRFDEVIQKRQKTRV